jgi:oligogalacturonide transport system substrate-binding protein
MKKFLSVAMLFILVCGLVFAQGGKENSSNDETIELRFMWWGGDARHKATLEVIELYQQKHPNVKISAEYSGSSGYQQKLFTQLAGGNAPDIIQVDAWWTDAQRKFNAFADLSKFSQLDRSGFDSQFVMDYGSMDDVIYCLPTGINAPLMVINKDVLADAGIEWRDQWTWEDILSEGPKVHASNPNRYFLNIDQYTATSYIQRAYLSQLSGNPTTLDDTYELGFTKEELVQVYEYIRKCYELNIMQPAESSMTYKQKSEQNPLWINGNAAVSLNWTSKLADLKAELPNLDVAVLPIMAEGAKNTGMFSRPSQLMAINAKSKHQEACADFLQFFFNDPEAQAILKDTRSVPPVESARALCEEKGLSDPLIVKATNNALAKPGVIDSVLSQDVVCIDLLYTEYENIAFGKETPEQAAETLMKGWTARLQELKTSK